MTLPASPAAGLKSRSSEASAATKQRPATTTYPAAGPEKAARKTTSEAAHLSVAAALLRLLGETKASGKVSDRQVRDLQRSLQHPDRRAQVSALMNQGSARVKLTSKVIETLYGVALGLTTSSAIRTFVDPQATASASLASWRLVQLRELQVIEGWEDNSYPRQTRNVLTPLGALALKERLNIVIPLERQEQIEAARQRWPEPGVGIPAALIQWLPDALAETIETQLLSAMKFSELGADSELPARTEDIVPVRALRSSSNQKQLNILAHRLKTAEAQIRRLQKEEKTLNLQKDQFQNALLDVLTSPDEHSGASRRSALALLGIDLPQDSSETSGDDVTVKEGGVITMYIGDPSGPYIYEVLGVFNLAMLEDLERKIGKQIPGLNLRPGQHQVRVMVQWQPDGPVAPGSIRVVPGWVITQQ